MQPEELFLILLMVFGLGVVVIAYYIPTHNPFAPIVLNTFTPTQTPTPHTSTIPTPTPEPSVPQPAPSPSPSIPPSPSPEASVLPPLWQELGFKCEVPSHLIGEQWVEEYKFTCACIIRGKYDLGVMFNVWDGCYSTTSTGWRRESCECVEIICKARRDLC